MKNKLQLTVFGIVFLTLISLVMYQFPATSYAADATPSSDLKTKLRALQDEIASKAAQLKSQVSTKLQNKSYWGTVKSKTDNTITLATKTGSKIISINLDTLYSYSKGKLTLKTINNDDFIIGLGDIDETAVLTARKIIKTTTIEFPELQTMWGIVTNLGESQFNIQTKDGKAEVITLDKNSDLRFGEAAAELSDVKLKKAVIVVGTTSKSGIKARFVYILPYTSLNLKTSLPSSVSPTASPSATPTTKKPISTPTPVKK